MHTSGNPATWKRNSTPAFGARFIALKSKIERVKRYTKAGIVLAGYAVAFAAAVIVFDLRMRANAGNPDAQGGMQAFGDSLLFLYVFGFAALLPTALALYYLRPVQTFWSVFSKTALVIAATALAAALVILLSKQPPLQSALTIPAVFGVLRLLLSPVLCPAFIACAFISPDTRSRRMLGIAAAVECAAGASWFASIIANRLH
jgi:hypothetical protein